MFFHGEELSWRRREEQEKRGSELALDTRKRRGKRKMCVQERERKERGGINERKNIRESFYLGNNLISWFSKKQNCVSLSTAEAEYIAAGSSCSQLVWMKQMLTEYNVEQDVMTLYCDNMSAINISKNPVQHSRTMK